MVLWANSKWRNTYLRKSWKFSKKLKTVVFEPRPLPLSTLPVQQGGDSTPGSCDSEMQAPSSSWLPIRGLSPGRSRTLALLICPQFLVVEAKFQVSEWEVRAPFSRLAPDCGLEAPYWAWHSEKAMALIVIALTCEMGDHMWDINWESFRLPLLSLAQSAYLLERGVTQREAWAQRFCLGDETRWEIDSS